MYKDCSECTRLQATFNDRLFAELQFSYHITKYPFLNIIYKDCSDSTRLLATFNNRLVLDHLNFYQSWTAAELILRFPKIWLLEHVEEFKHPWLFMTP